ncbi:MAG: hypothetical protein HZB91_03755 [Elusimicrobia bacterium]|nr:hypothetical protein [Elusimicrobiota bacterium]
MPARPGRGEEVITNAIRLELSKQRLSFWGMAAAFAVSVPLAMFGAKVGRIALSEAMEALMMFWTTVGIPVMAVFFGATAGAGLRREPAASAEASLPLPPRRRAAAAFCAAGIYLAAVAFLVAVFGPLRPEAADIVGTGATAVSRLMAGLAVLCVLYLALTGFAAAYVSGHGLAGGLAGAVLGGSTAVFLGLGCTLSRLLPGPELGFGWRALAICGLSIVAAAWAADVFVERGERRVNGGRPRVLLAFLCLACGMVLSASFVKRSAFEVLARTFLKDDRPRIWEPEQAAAGTYLPAVASAERQGALAKAQEGALYWLTPEGRRVALLTEEPVRLRNFLFGPYWWVDFSTEWGNDGSLWVLLSSHRRKAGSGEAFELYHGGTGGRLSLHSVLSASPAPRALVRRGRELGVLGRQGDDYHFAPLPEKGMPGRWTKVGASNSEWNESVANALVRDGLAVWAGTDGRLRKGKEKGAFLCHAITVAGKTLFLVPTNEGERSYASVYEGRRLVRKVWEAPDSRRFALERAADGTWWGLRDKSSLHLLTREGEFLPPISLEAALKSLPAEEARNEAMPRVLRVEGGMLWLLAAEGGRLLKVELATGQVSRSWDLPKGRALTGPSVTEKGFFLDTSRALYFIDWEGKARKLEWKS